MNLDYLYLPPVMHSDVITTEFNHWLDEQMLKGTWTIDVSFIIPFDTRKSIVTFGTMYAYLPTDRQDRVDAMHALFETANNLRKKHRYLHNLCLAKTPFDKRIIHQYLRFRGGC